ncbi:hypothetical protein EDB83DRAFT_30572 [Lactarius deliciosus]|nr:hypothetical protein EDB83DRAFT_30572 [Lactarius deliciosus]
MAPNPRDVRHTGTPARAPLHCSSLPATEVLFSFRNFCLHFPLTIAALFIPNYPREFFFIYGYLTAWSWVPSFGMIVTCTTLCHKVP